MIKVGQIYKSQILNSRLRYEVLELKKGLINVRMTGGKEKSVILTMQPEHFLKIVGIYADS